jgi:hypothetical protein
MSHLGISDLLPLQQGAPPPSPPSSCPPAAAAASRGGVPPVYRQAINGGVPPVPPVKDRQPMDSSSGGGEGDGRGEAAPKGGVPRPLPPAARPQAYLTHLDAPVLGEAKGSRQQIAQRPPPAPAAVGTREDVVVGNVSSPPVVDRRALHAAVDAAQQVLRLERLWRRLYT